MMSMCSKFSDTQGGIAMKTTIKLLSLCLLLAGAVSIMGNTAYAEEDSEVMVQVEQVMPVLKGDTWVKMSNDEKISFLWGAGHVVSIQEVLARNNPDLKKSNTFVNKIMEARTNKPMTMNEVAAKVDEYYQANPDKLDKPVVEVIWKETIVPNLSQTQEPADPAQ
jgi:hypothetical protein